MTLLRMTGLLMIAAVSAAPSVARAEGKVKVFVLAGQSNMEGKAKNSLFDYQATAEETKGFFAHLRDGTDWVVRDDVFIKYLKRHGKLTLGYGSSGRTGIEYEFGYRMGEHYEEPVLLIKAAWGGHSLYRDFRSPSNPPSQRRLDNDLSTAKRRYERLNEKKREETPEPTTETTSALYGASYRNMMAEVADVRENLADLFPELAGQELEIAGFVWFQGWNDKYGGGDIEYQANMEAFIKDVRKDLGAPMMPFVIAVMGQGGPRDLDPRKPIVVIQKAQLAMNDVPAFAGNVKAYRTDVLVDEAAQEAIKNYKADPETWKRRGSDEGFHYLGSAIWFTRIGRAGAEAMIELIETQGPKTAE